MSTNLTNLTVTGTVIVDWMSTGLINAGFKQFAFVCKLITALLITRLLLLVRFRPAVLRVPELSRALRTFLCFHLAGAIVTMPYNAYVPITYYTATTNDDTVQETQPIYNYSMLFWLGQFHNTYTALSPLAVLFLTLERCFIIKLATNPAKLARVERWLGWAGIGTLLAAFTASTCFYMDELPLNLENLYDIGCQSVSCVMRKWDNAPQMYIKGITSILNIVCCVYFLYSLRTIGAMVKLKNHHIIVTICCAICLDFFPALVSNAFFILGSGLMSNLASTCTVLDSLCCAIYFTIAFVPPGWLKRGANANVRTTNVQQREPPKQQNRTHRISSFNNTVVPITNYSNGMVPIGTVAARI
ncbi:hypothetical protein niasHT_037373 [Heterodera trifolii]|uniref:Uncharacterized protein n=1 Tax=Heterodera trifolii TaxID=157864 RepID=A0ABD2J2P1_9BILA